MYFSIGAKTVVESAGWSIGECTNCGGMEAVRIEHRRRVYSLMHIPVNEDSDNYSVQARCDLCGCYVTRYWAAARAGFDTWHPQQGLTQLARLISLFPPTVRQGPEEQRIRSALSSIQSEIRPLRGRATVGCLIGFPLGMALGCGALNIIRRENNNQGLTALDLTLILGGGALGAIASAVVHELVRWRNRALRLLRSIQARYHFNPEAIIEQSAMFSGRIQRAARRLHDEASLSKATML